VRAVRERRRSSARSGPRERTPVCGPSSPSPPAATAEAGARRATPPWRRRARYAGSGVGEPCLGLRGHLLERVAQEGAAGGEGEQLLLARDQFAFTVGQVLVGQPDELLVLLVLGVLGHRGGQCLEPFGEPRRVEAEQLQLRDRPLGPQL